MRCEVSSSKDSALKQDNRVERTTSQRMSVGFASDIGMLVWECMQLEVNGVW
jgi:hypothetical protein